MYVQIVVRNRVIYSNMKIKMIQFCYFKCVNRYSLAI